MNIPAYDPSKFAARQGDDDVDLPFFERQRIALAAAVSPELIPNGPRYVPGLAIGDFAVPQGDMKIVVKGQVGFETFIVGFGHSVPEYLPGRGKLVTIHAELPPDAKFLYASDGVEKTGFWLKNGNKVVPTVTAHLLVNGHGCVYDFYSSAYKIGKHLVVMAQRLRGAIQGADGRPVEVKGCTLGKFLFTSHMESPKGAATAPYPLPVVTLVGKLGQPNGPTLAQFKQLRELRQAFRDGLDWVPVEAIEPPAPPAENKVTAPRPDIRTGKGVWINEPRPRSKITTVLKTTRSSTTEASSRLGRAPAYPGRGLLFFEEGLHDGRPRRGRRGVRDRGRGGQVRDRAARRRALPSRRGLFARLEPDGDRHHRQR
jgi:hypothetical protein